MKYIILVIFSLYGMSLTAQCNTDTHSTAKADSWLSCEKSMSPNTNRPEGHWLMIDLGEVKNIESTYFWNYNANESAGVKTLAIDVSADGFNWTHATDITLAKATQKTDYIGESSPNVDQTARFILLSVLESYGDGNCAGLSEIKLNVRKATSTNTNVSEVSIVNNEIAIYPNPASQSIKVDFGTNGRKQYQILSMSGAVLYRSMTSNQEEHVDVEFLKSGTYILTMIDEMGILTSTRFIKI